MIKNIALGVAITSAIGLAIMLIDSKNTDTDSLIRKNVIGVTAQCNDGKYTTAKTRRGACSFHGGIKRWYD